ncbi:hypothetical protein [Amycolatopsis thailandensis]|uniref:hypothetical protein n=1 Tax=Amycolatopsis thailandensis TaxID=589330 RepID=UPI00362B461F
MNHVLAGVLTEDLLTRLDGYDTLAQQQARPSASTKPGAAIQALAAAIRAVLTVHTVEPHGPCPGCPRRGWRRPRGCRLPHDLTQHLARTTEICTSGRHAFRP